MVRILNSSECDVLVRVEVAPNPSEYKQSVTPNTREINLSCTPHLAATRIPCCHQDSPAVFHNTSPHNIVSAIMSSFEDHLDRMGKLENLLKQVQTIAARGDNYGPAMKVLELWLPDVASEKIISERARDIERDLMKRKESLTAQKAECDKREAAIASREAKIAER